MVTQSGRSSSWRPGAPEGATEGGSRTRESMAARETPSQTLSWGHLPRGGPAWREPGNQNPTPFLPRPSHHPLAEHSREQRAVGLCKFSWDIKPGGGGWVVGLEAKRKRSSTHFRALEILEPWALS